MYHERPPRVSLTLVPALMTAVAYVDPGNFGSNISAGASHGYQLIWVVVVASAAAALVQYLAAKLGLMSGRSLTAIGAARMRRPARLMSWVGAELVVIMTDLAELVGGALGLDLLFGTPLLIGAALLGVLSFAVLGLSQQDTIARVVVLVLLTVVGGTVLVCCTLADPALMPILRGLQPTISDQSGVLIAAAIVGATVMPHALFFHSAISADSGSVQHHSIILQYKLVRSIVIAMILAAVVNLGILVIGAQLPPPAVDDLLAAHNAVGTAIDAAAPPLLGVALLTSGLASTIVGTYTGQIVTASYLKRNLPLWLRRVIGVLPPVIALAFGLDPMKALFYSQVMLCFALPFTLVPLVRYCGSKAVMGRAVPGTAVLGTAWTVTVLIIGMNAVLLYLTFLD